MRKTTTVYKIKNSFSENRKWEIFKTAQENQIFLKRLNEKQSFYDKKKWEKDYEKSRVYKKNICVFPSLNFETLKGEDFNYGKTNYFNLSQKIKLSEGSMQNNVNHLFSEETEKNKQRQNLYNKEAVIGDLLTCKIIFYVEDKK